MKTKKYRRMRADIEMDRRVATAKEKVLEVLRGLSERRARRVVAATAILLGHGEIVGIPDCDSR